MKSMATIYHRQQAYRNTKAGQRMIKQESENIVRKNFAIVLRVLHDSYGFGPERLKRFVSDCNAFVAEAEKDDLWFDTVSAWIEKYTNMDLWADDWMEGKNNGGGND